MRRQARPCRARVSLPTAMRALPFAPARPTPSGARLRRRAPPHRFLAHPLSATRAAPTGHPPLQGARPTALVRSVTLSMEAIRRSVFASVSTPGLGARTSPTTASFVRPPLQIDFLPITPVDAYLEPVLAVRPFRLGVCAFMQRRAVLGSAVFPTLRSSISKSIRSRCHGFPPNL